MKKYLSGRKILAFITMFLIVLSTNLFRTSAAGSVSGGANGATVGATATVAGLPVNVTLASAAPVTLPSTGGNVTDQIASVGVDLAGVATVLSTGVIVNSTSGTINASTAHATSTSTVNGINILNGFITAGTIVSKATSDGNGTSATSTGAGSMINNLRINGVLQETSNVAPNTVISATGHITVVVGIVPVNVPLNATITLNAQTQSGNGTTTSGIDVAQLVVNVTGNVAGLVSLNVNVAIALASSGVNFTAAPNTCPTVSVSGGTSRSVQVGQTLTFNVSATDPDGDTTTLSASNLPANSSFTPNPATGTPTATGTFSFTPAAGQANQTFNVQFTGSDNRGCGGSSPVPVTVQIQVTPAPPGNNCPVVNVTGGTSRTIQAGQTLTFNVSATDPDGDTATLQATNLPANSSFTPNPATGTPTATGTFSFTPAAGQANQTFNVQFTATDTHGCSGAGATPVTVQITVTAGPPPNNCPAVTVTGGTTRNIQAGQTLTFDVSATDADGDTVTLQAANLPANSSFTPNPATGTPTATGTFSFTPAAGQANQTFNVQFTGSDTRGCSGAGATPVTVQITVTPGPPPNTCPVVNVTGGTTRSVQAGQTLSFNVSATDADGDAVTLTASNLPANSSFTPNPATGTPTATGVFSFTPAAGQANQTFNVQFTGTDTRGCSGAGATPVTVQITVTAGPPPNTCPAVTVTGGTSRTIQAGQTLGFNVSATDADGDAVTLTASNLPANATFTPNPATGTPTATGAFSFTPAAGQANQTFNVLFTATDTRGCSGAGATPVTVQITVTPPPANNCPVVNVPFSSQTIQVGQTLTFNVSATDADGDTVTLTASNLPSHSSFTPNPATGTPTATGAFSFTPAAGQANQTFNVLFTGSDTRGCSGASATPVTVQITVTAGPPPNNCPNLSAPTTVQTVQVGQTLTFTASATDPDGDTVTLTASNLPAGGSFTPNPATGTPTASGVFNFTPTAGQANQTFNVTFTATDNRGCSTPGTGNSRTVQINVTPAPANRCPVVSVPGASQTVQAGQTLTFNVSATDPDGDSVTLQASNLPANASFNPNPASGTPTATGTFSFTPVAGQANQTFSVQFTGSDNRGCSGAGASPVTVQITVTPGPPPNRCPTVNAPATVQTVQVGQTLNFNVSATDPDGDTVTLQAANLPAHSSFTPNPATGTPTATGAFSFTPAAGQANQTFTVQFTGSDNRGCSGAGASPITVQINVTSGPPPNSCPNISVPSATQIVPVGQVLTFNVSATDPDGDTVTLQASNLPANATFTPSPATGTPTATGTLRFTPSAAQGGQAFNVLFTASDNRGCTGGAPVTVQITVPPGGTGNQCPIITVTNVAPSVTVGQNLTFEVSATDPDGDTVTLQAVNMPSGASFIPNPATGTPTVTGVFSFLPTASQANATFNVQFFATDSRGCSGSGTVPVTVTITVFPPPGGGANNCPVLTAPTTVQNFVVGRTTTFNVSATDPDGDAVTITATNLPAGATFTPNPAIGTPTAVGVFTWTPSAAQASLSFNVTFTATDTRGCSSSSGGSPNSRTVQINVAGSDEAGGSPGACGNHAPIISIPTLPFAGLSETLTFLVRATDQDGDAVTVTAASLPDNATYDAATGKVSFSPSTQQLQQAQLGQGSVAVFVAQDTKGAKSTAFVDITPLATESDPKAPLLSIPAGPLMVKVVDRLSFGVAALAQTNSCSTSITVEGLPTGATFDAATNLFSFTPTAAQMGQSFVLNFTATDCAGRKKEASLRIIVTDADANCVARGSGDADLSVKRIDFTNTKVGDVSGAATISLTNRGGGPLMVSSFTFSDDTSYAIEGLGVLPATLQPGGVIEFRILFMPRAKGTFNSVLTIFTSDPDTPALEVALKGKSNK